MGADTLRQFHFGHRGAHFLRAHRIAFQPAKKAPLVSPPGGARNDAHVLARRPNRGGIARRRFARQVNIVKIDRIDRTAQFRRECFVHGQQPQRAVCRALGQILDVARELREGAGSQCKHIGRALFRHGVQRGDQAFEGLAHAGDSVKPDDVDRAVRLVQAGMREPDLHRILRLAFERDKRIGAAFQRGIDLALDPGKRPGVEAGAFSAHALYRIALIVAFATTPGTATPSS